MGPKRRKIIKPKKKDFHLKVGGTKIPYDPLNYKSIDAALEAFDRLSEVQRLQWIQQHPEMAHFFRKPKR